jgi:lysophospholipase L1-like esterase
MSTTRSRGRVRRSAVASALGVLLLVTAAGAATADPGGATPVPAQDVYVAMGDSYSAGTGTGYFDIDPACQQSSLGYPALVAAERLDTRLTLVACGFGVTTQTLIDTQVDVLDQHTDFVTMTVGGNDLGFATIAGACVYGDDTTCLAVAGQASQFMATQLPSRLDAAYDAIRARVHKAEVVVVGYPKFYADDYVPCYDSYGITEPEAATLNELVVGLDAVIGNRARAAGFTYVSALDAFTGHDMCATEPWVNGVVSAPTQADVYHPTAAGYADGYAPLVLAAMAKRHPSVSQVHAR